MIGLARPDAFATRDAEARQALAAIVAEIAVAAGPPSAAMRQAFIAALDLLGLPASDGDRLLASAEAAWDEPGGQLPASLCGGNAQRTREALDEAYVRAVARYDPVTMAQFGAPMAALAVHRLMDLTMIYESDVARFETESAMDDRSEGAG